MKDLHEVFKIPKWMNQVEVWVEDGVLRVEFESVDEDVIDDEDE